MKKNYLLTLIFAVLLSNIAIAQTTVSYPQQAANYNAVLSDGGASFDNGVDQLGMWANNGNKQTVAWRNFTDDGTTSGNASTMNVGDIFKISLSAYQAYGQIGLSLLSSPSATATWDDRINNYAVQVNLNGNSGAYDPWEIISNGGAVNASTINGSDEGSINEFVFTFTLTSPTKMEVIIERTNNTPTSFTQTVTINNSNISGYSIYLADDWDNNDKQNIYWKQTTEYVYANVWDGSTDTDWDTAANWSSNSVPSATANVRIPKTAITNFPTASTAVTINSAYVESGATLIAQDAFTGSITYERNLAVVDKWYLVSPPVSGETIENLISNHTFATGSGGGRIGLAAYVNDGTAWNYQTAASTGALNAGQGYSVRLAAAGNISLTGTMPVADVGIVITTNTNGFNLVGNPFPSFIAANNNADAINNILKVNDTDNDFLTEPTIWLWNQANTSYDEVNHTGNTHIAPGQGFFVSSNGSNTFSITEAMQSHQGTDTFQKSASTRPEIQLILTNGTKTRDADIFYIDGKTTGFDNGYDSSIFGGVSHSFAVFTEAVANGNGKRLGIQSLPNTDLESMVIPVGVIADAVEITFSAEALNLPTGIKVFLEDRTASTITRLDEANSEYTITLNEALNGAGRFYLHTTQEALSIDTNATLENVSIYKTNASTLRIVGLQQGNASVKLFNMLGKQVMSTSFKTNAAQNISLPQLAKGVYIVQLTTETGKLNKKIVLE